MLRLAGIVPAMGRSKQRPYSMCLGVSAMLTSINAFLRYFDAVNRRALRDVGALPAAADGWRPAIGEGEKAWSINGIVGHMASSRLYFASAYRGEGWIFPPQPDVSRRERWLPVLEESAAAFRRQLEGTPDAWLTRKVQMIDSDGAISGWRALIMMVEHDSRYLPQHTALERTLLVA